MHSLKIICDGRTRKDGLNSIRILFSYSGKKRTELPTGMAIPSEFWQKKHGRVSTSLPDSLGSASKMNKELQGMLRTAEDLITIAEEKKIDVFNFVKLYFKPDLKVESLDEQRLQAERLKEEMEAAEAKKKTVFYQIDDYIQTQLRRVTPDMVRIYRNMKYHLERFEEFRGKPITFEEMDLNFYRSLVDYLIYDYVQRRSRLKTVGLKINTVGKTINQLRTFLRDRIRRKIIAPIDMTGWEVLEEETDAVYVTMEEIGKIYGLDLSAYPEYERYRNDFVLGCLTGLRFSDFQSLEKFDVRGDLLYKKQKKSKHWVVIPLRPVAREILEKRFENDAKPLCNVLFNRYIKDIARMAGLTEIVKHSYRKQNKVIVEAKPKCEWILSHTCRRSFCTNEFLAGTPVELIMKISGHKSVKDFYRYIRISPEEAAMKMQEIWMERAKTLAGGIS